MTTSAAVPAGSNFRNSLAYTLALSLTNDANVLMSALCSSAQLQSGQTGCSLSPGNSTGLSSGGRTAINRTASLSVSWTPPAIPQRLLAGSYSDTITLSIAAVP